MEPWTHALKVALLEYRSDAYQCCDRCGKTSEEDSSQVAFAHGWKKAMGLAYKLAAESSPNIWKYDREELLRAFRAHANITEQS